MRQELEKVLRGALLAAIGVFGSQLLDGLNGVDFGPYQVYVAGALSVAANAFRKLVWPKIVNHWEQPR